MRIKQQSLALLASLLVLIVSGYLTYYYAYRASMAYYTNDPERREVMSHLQRYADISSVVFICAGLTCVALSILIFRARRQARIGDLGDKHTA